MDLSADNSLTPDSLEAVDVSVVMDDAGPELPNPANGPDNSDGSRGPNTPESKGKGPPATSSPASPAALSQLLARLTRKIQQCTQDPKGKGLALSQGSPVASSPLPSIEASQVPPATRSQPLAEIKPQFQPAPEAVSESTREKTELLGKAPEGVAGQKRPISRAKRSSLPKRAVPLRKKKSHTELIKELMATHGHLLRGGGDDEPLPKKSRRQGKLDESSQKHKGKAEDDGSLDEEADDDIEFEFICEEGDLCLAVGKDPVVVFEVSSQSLIAASPVLAEKIELVKRQPGSRNEYDTLWLPDKDPYTIRNICLIASHQNNQVPTRLEPDELLLMAMTAVEYALEPALKFAARQWLFEGRFTDCYAGDPATTSACYMVAANMFGDKAMFDDYMRKLVTTCARPFQSVWRFGALKWFLNDAALNLLTVLRDKARLKISHILTSEIGLGCYSKWDKQRQKSYEEILPKLLSRTISQHSLVVAVHEVRKTLGQRLGGAGMPLECLSSISDRLKEVLDTCGISMDKYREAMGKGSEGLQEVIMDTNDDEI